MTQTIYHTTQNDNHHNLSTNLISLQFNSGKVVLTNQYHSSVQSKLEDHI